MSLAHFSIFNHFDYDVVELGLGVGGMILKNLLKMLFSDLKK